MKKLITIFCLALASCGDSKKSIPNFRVVEIDGCEYIVHDDSFNYSYAIAHKGNCKNHTTTKTSNGQNSVISIDGTSGNHIEVNQK